MILLFYSCLARNRPVKQPAAEPLGSDAHDEKYGIGQERGEYDLLAQSSVGKHLDAHVLASSALPAAAAADVVMRGIPVLRESR